MLNRVDEPPAARRHRPQDFFLGALALSERTASLFSAMNLVASSGPAERF